ncbi:MAG: mechanosensitive ion channel [Planctomycetota bacterium]|nr:mechanosensitive ion channel [Planctomycetota bacterium]
MQEGTETEPQDGIDEVTATIAEGSNWKVFDSIRETFSDNSTESLVIALAVLVAGVFGLWVVRGVLTERFARVAAKTRNRMDDVAVELMRATHWIFLLILSFYAASLVLEVSETLAKGVGRVTFLALLLQFAFWGNRAISFMLAQPPRKEGDVAPQAATTLRAVGFLGRLAVWTIVVLIALSNLGVDVSALIAGLGISGIAVALALQNILGDLFSSVSIVLDKPFVPGDYILVGDLGGTVEHIGLKTTRVRGLGGEQIVFSNSDLLSSRVRNYKRMAERRILFSFGVVYQISAEKLKQIPSMVREIIDQQKHARADRIHFKKFGDSTLDFEVVYYMEVPDYGPYMDTQQAINLALFERFEKEGIEFGYPTHTVFLEREGAAT